MLIDRAALTAYIVAVDPVYAYITVAIIAAGSILMYLMVKSSDEFSVEETEKNSDDFANVIRDSHGPVTTWLWVAYIVMVIWVIAYLIQHSAEFATFP
jgi:magnesium-transporting ATPase (P-type)